MRYCIGWSQKETLGKGFLLLLCCTSRVDIAMPLANKQVCHFYIIVHHLSEMFTQWIWAQRDASWRPCDSSSTCDFIKPPACKVSLIHQHTNQVHSLGPQLVITRIFRVEGFDTAGEPNEME